ncbi:MAG: hypothetical protein ACR2HI_01870 [Gaiella sp.]
MDISKLSQGAKLMLGGTIVFVIVSFFKWFKIDEDLTGGIDLDAGINMWHGVGVIAGLLAIALLVWEGLRLADVKLEFGVSASLVSMALAGLLLLFTFIRFIDGYTGFDRTIFAFLGLILAILIAAGAFLNMQSSGRSFSDMKGEFSGAVGSARNRGATTSTTPPPADPMPPTTPPADPMPPTPPADTHDGPETPRTTP